MKTIKRQTRVAYGCLIAGGVTAGLVYSL